MSFSNQMEENMKNNFQRLYNDNQLNKSKLFSSNEEIFKN